jgi:hypothetical protein
MKAAAGMAAATVEAAASDCTAAVESTSASNYTAAAICTPGVPARVPASITSAVAEARASVDSMTPISATAPISRMTPSPVVPRSGTDEHPAYKPPGAIEAVRRASIRIIGVIAVCANRRTIGIALVGIFVIVPVSRALIVVLIGTALVVVLIVLIATALIVVLVRLPLVVSRGNPSIHLRLRVRKRQRQHSHQRKIFQITHRNPPWLQIRSPSSISDPETFLRPVAFVGAFSASPWVPCLYLFERGTRRKVAGIGVVDFSHPG